MGGSDSKFNYSQDGLKYFEENFDFVDKVSIDNYNEFRVYQEKLSGGFIVTTEDNFNITRDSKYLLDEVQEAMALNHIGLLRIVGYQREVHDGFCGINVTITVYNEWYNHNLLKEIQDRAKKKVEFCD